MNRGFTEYERRALTRSLRTHGKRPMPEWAIDLTLAIAFLFVLSYTCDNVLHLTSIAHAETTGIHQNSYYCPMVRAGEPVQGATAKQLKKVCP